MLFCTPDMIVAVSGAALYFVDAGSGDVVYEVREAHVGGVTDVAVQMVDEGLPRIATVGLDGRIRLWRVP